MLLEAGYWKSVSRRDALEGKSYLSQYLIKEINWKGKEDYIIIIFHV